MPFADLARVAALGLALLAGGCSEYYFAHRETNSPFSGEAPAANAAIHKIDPWPPYAANTSIPHRGQRIQNATDRYDKPPATPGDSSTPGMGGGLVQQPGITTR